MQICNYATRQWRAVVLSVAVTLLFAGCSKQAEENKEQKETAVQPMGEKTEKSAAAGEKEPESRVKRDTNGTVVITLDSPTQKLIGLQTAEIKAAKLSPELKGYGRVLDASPLVSLVAELTTAQAANEESQAELSRLKTLAGQNNASERALQAGEAADAHDRAQVVATRLKLVASWGTVIAHREDLAAFVESLSTASNALVEIDLPAGEAVPAMPTGGRLLTLSDHSQTVEAQFLGSAPAVDPQMQGRGFLFLVAPNAVHLRPGAAVTGFLSLPGEEQSGVLVPRDAVIRFNGGTWTYRQTGEDTFERIEVSLAHPLADGWFVSEGFKAGDKLVLVGAQQLLSEELKGASAGGGD